MREVNTGSLREPVREIYLDRMCQLMRVPDRVFSNSCRPVLQLHVDIYKVKLWQACCRHRGSHDVPVARPARIHAQRRPGQAPRARLAQEPNNPIVMSGSWWLRSGLRFANDLGPSACGSYPAIVHGSLRQRHATHLDVQARPPRAIQTIKPIDISMTAKDYEPGSSNRCRAS